MPEQIQIDFTPETHEYKVNGKKAKISVTALIDKQISKTEWFAIDPEILQKAAARGTDVHADLEYFVGKGTEPRTQECKNFAEYLKAHQWKIEEPRTEFKLAIEHTAERNGIKHSFILCGTADLICVLNGKHIILDYKTTSVIHEQEVRWQMSLLDYMARQLNGKEINGEPFIYVPAEEMYVFHFDKQAKFKPVKVDPIPDVEIIRLLDAEALEEEYHSTPVDILTPKQEQRLLDIEKRLTALKAAQALLANEEASLKAQMEQAFQAHPATRKVELSNLTISYKPGTTRTTFDTARFEKDHPDLYKQYCVVTEVKGSVSITLSKQVKEQIEAYSSDIPSLPALPKPARKNSKRGYFE